MYRTLKALIRSLDFILIDSILIINSQDLGVCEVGRVVVRVTSKMMLCPKTG